MTAILFLAVLVIALFLCILHSKVNKLTRENESLRYRLEELWRLYREHFTAHQQNQQETAGDITKAPPISAQTQPSQVQPAQPARAEQPMSPQYSPQQYTPPSAQAQPAQAQPAQTQPQPTQPMSPVQPVQPQYAQQQYTPQPVRVQPQPMQPVQPMRSVQPVQQPQTAQPVQPVQTPPQYPQYPQYQQHPQYQQQQPYPQPQYSQQQYSQPVQTQPAQFQPAQPAQAQQPQYTQGPPLQASAPVGAQAKKGDTPSRIENWFGSNVLGIAAAILFFVGLIVFAVWIYNDVSQGVGTILMYATSFIIAATGLILTLRRRNAFTLILCGCGCGLLFISILLSYVYFGRMSDIVTFVLLLAWLAITLVLARKLNSILISILAHIGMVISLCFAYAVGLQEDKLILLLAYQLASIAVIVIGNTLCCKKTYRFGLFLSMIVTIAAGSFMQTQFIGVFPPDNIAFPMAFMPDWMASSAFFTQFLTASFLSYLLAGSTSKLENSSSKIGVHLVNKFLWTAALCVNLLPIVFRMAFTYSDGMAHRSVLATGIMAGIGFAVLLVHSIISLIMGKKGTLDKRLEEISVILSSAIASVLLLIFWLCCYLSGISAPCLPLLIIPAILLLWAGIYGGKTSYKITANILLGLDWILMAFIGFNELTLFGSIVLPFVYMLMYMLLIQWQHTTLPPERKEKLLSPLYLFNYLFVQVNAVIILISLSYDYKYPLLLVYLCTVNIIANIFRYNRAGYKPLCYCMRISEGIILLSSLWVIAFAPYGGQLYTGFSITLAVLTAAYAFINVHLLLKQRSDVEAVLFGLKLTLITLAVINGFTSWFDSSYIATLTAMGTLLLCLAAGYLWRLSGLVKYGLIGMLLCVLKLLSYDFFFCNSLTAFISLFAGGVLFFITQLLYNRFDTKAVPVFKTLLRIGQLLLLGMSAASVAFDSHIGTAEFTFSILLTVLLFVWSFFWTPGMLIRSEQKGAVLEGIKFTVLVLAVISGYTNWFNNGYVATLVAMSTAIICLAVGYLRKIRGLVLYGLIGAMFCILKLIFIDILVNFELSRLIAMLGGSLGFFAVNLLYNRFDTKNPAFTMLIRIGQLLTLAASAAVIAFTPHFGTAAVVVSILLTAQSFIWAFFQTPKTLGHSGQGEAVLEGIKLSVLVLATIQGHTDWFANAYILSFVCMITSLLCIIAGFIRRVGSLRLYGLVLTLVCVLKLVTWDVAGLETMLRTLSLIGGGIICFAISAIYSYSVKRLPISSEVVQHTIAPTEQFTPPDKTE